MNRKQSVPGELKLDDQGHIRLAFAQLDVIDSDGDVTIAGAFPSKAVPMSAYGHTSWEGALPVGKGTIAEDSGWAVYEGDFFMSTTHGRDAFETVKELGELAEYSYGFNVLDSERGTKDGKPVRFLKSLDVFEVSPVLKGAGVGTHTLSIKSGVPGIDAPYSDYMDWYTSHWSEIIERTKDRVLFRKSEGRSLSDADIKRLGELANVLQSGLDDLGEFLLPKAQPKRRDNTLAVEIERARALGVKT